MTGPDLTERRARTPLIHLQFYIELGFDAGLSEGAFNVIEFAHPPLEDWADFDLQAFLGMPELPEPAVRPCVVMRFRRVTKPAAPLFRNVATAYAEELSEAIPSEDDLESPTTSVTVVKAERIVPSPTGEYDERWLREQFQVVLSKLNTQLLALGAAAENHRIRPVHTFELPPMLIGWEQDLRDLGDPDKPPRLFLLFLHPGEERVSSDHDATIINHAMAISEHMGRGPFSPALEFLYAARRSLEAGRAGHAVLEAGTAVELLVDGVVRGVGMTKAWTSEKLENVLVRTPFRSRYVHHFARSLRVSVSDSESEANAVSDWLRGGYDLRNRVAHFGYQPTDKEAAEALIQARSLLDFVGDRAEHDPALGISFPDIGSLLPHPELDERSIAREGPTSEARLAREAFAEGVAAVSRGDTEAAAGHFAEASRQGSPGGAFNVAMTRWHSRDLAGARESLQLAADRGHTGASAYLGMLLLAEGQEAEAQQVFREVVPGAHSGGWPLAAFFLATLLANRDEPEEAAGLYRQAAVVGDFTLGADAAFRRGALLRDLGDAGAIDAWTFAVELGSARAAIALANVFTSEGDADAAIAMLRRASKLEGDPVDDGVDIGYGLRIHLGDGTPSVQEEIARATIMAAGSLDELGRDEEAVVLCDELVQAYSDATSPILHDAVARALVSKSAYLGRMGRHAETLEVSEEVLSRFGDVRHGDVYSQVTSALLNKAAALLQLGRSEDALAAYDEAFARLDEASSEEVTNERRQGLLNRAVLLRELGRLDESVAACDRVLSSIDAALSPAAQEQATVALINKAAALSSLGHWEDAVAVDDELVRRLADRADKESQERMAWVVLSKADALGQAGRKAEAIAVYDDLAARFGASGNSQIREHLATALVHKGILLAELERPSEAMATNDEVVARFDQIDEGPLREQVARALVNNAVILVTTGRASEALAIDDDLISRFPSAELQVARALMNRSVALDKLDRVPEALSACDAIMTRFGTSTDPKLREIVAGALLNKGEMAGQLGRREEATSAYREVITRFRGATDPVLAQRVAQASQELDGMQTHP